MTQVAFPRGRVLSGEVACPGSGLQCAHALTQWFRPRSVVKQASSMAWLKSPNHAKNVSSKSRSCCGSLIFFEHESTFTDAKQRESRRDESHASQRRARTTVLRSAAVSLPYGCGYPRFFFGRTQREPRQEYGVFRPLGGVFPTKKSVRKLLLRRVIFHSSYHLLGGWCEKSVYFSKEKHDTLILSVS